MSNHNKDKLKFWVTCLECGEKFGVNVDTVLKYVDRVFDELTENLEEAGKDFTDEGEEEGA